MAALHHHLRRHVGRAKHHLKNAFIPHAGNDYRPHALRHHWIATYAGSLLILKVGVVVVLGILSNRAYLSSITPESIIAGTNTARQANKAPALAWNTLLTKAAQDKANDMISHQYFAHISPSKVTPWYWIQKDGYQYRYAGENLAIDFITSEDVIDAWLKSPSHRQNLLNAKYRDIGVAVASGKIQGVESLIVVQMFGTPVPPSIAKTAPGPVQVPPVPKKAVAVKTPAAPKTKTVLGQAETTPTPPAVTPPVLPTIVDMPTLITPAPSSYVKTVTPTIAGAAPAGSTVHILLDGREAGTAVTATDGTYEFVPDNAWGEGPHRLQVFASNGSVVSPSTVIRTVTVDSLPPAIAESASYALPSIAAPRIYDLAVTASTDTVQVEVNDGQTVTRLRTNQGVYVGHVIIRSAVNDQPLTVTAVDLAGNDAVVSIVSPQFITPGIVAPTSSPTVAALQIMLYSRTFMLIFLSLATLLAFLNVIIHWERQHHLTIVSSILLIYFTGALLLL